MRNKKSRQTMKYFFVAFVVSVLVGYIFTAIFSSAEDIDVGKDFDIVETEFEGIRMLTFDKQEELYEIKFQLPVFESDRLNNYFKRYMKQTNQEFLNTIKGNVTEERPGSLYVILDIYSSGTDLYSLVSSEEAYTGGANVNQTKEVWMVDLQTNKLIQQSTLFENIQQARDVIMPQVRDALLESEYGVFEDELNDWMKQPNYDFNNMYIRDGNLVFKFDKYEVAPGASGMPEVDIPIDEEIRGLFKQEWLQRIEG
ncbi:DUF3298 and DUF4163 domain-containing protein [Tenuibacillus multivorans]|uniref:DUF3298 domain-containing protein n=1 Tax=Tenuibacillus multivorans TaxID=237069 RepID=A0A1H0B4I5_9BACI|nr:DUF3298 and DUF4163 domain-containing protein [Tenuibacillus multivorans]GEL77530.1 anti-sigma-V factor RsiV [Tenuibacillus multivorans]SDN40588.1 Protein of unknown function [Tenuibacillus multivorans]